jgi:predicted O-methyltransferase YrrM
MQYLNKIKNYLNILILKFYIFKNKLSQDNLIFTHLTEQEKILIYKIIKTNKPNICVEIGSFVGASSCFICNAIPKKSKLYCIDTWGNHAMKYCEEDNEYERDTYEVFQTNTQKYRNKIIEIRKWSTEAIDDLRQYESSIDFLFIDGDHNYESVKKDWELYSPLLHINSVVAFHDTGWADGVNKVISESVISRSKKIAELPNIQFFKIIK